MTHAVPVEADTLMRTIRFRLAEVAQINAPLLGGGLYAAGGRLLKPDSAPGDEGLVDGDTVYFKPGATLEDGNVEDPYEQGAGGRGGVELGFAKSRLGGGKAAGVEWACGGCTLLNAANAKECEACGGKR